MSKKSEDLVDPLKVIPHEFWKRCWDLVPRDDLKSLCCVCQLFRKMCQPLLFKVFKFSISRIVNGFMFSQSRSDATIIKEKIAALHGVISDPLLVESVHNLIISTIHLETSIQGNNHLFVETQTGQPPLYQFIAAILESLPRFSKTKSLVLVWPQVLSGYILDKILDDAAFHLPIEDLTLCMDKIPSRNFDKFPSLKTLQLIKPSKFNYEEDPVPDGQISIPASVEYLFAESLKVAPNVLRGMLEKNRHDNLISFELHVGRRSFPLLLQCLPSCPKLKYLVINVSSRTVCSTRFQLSETSVPHLETYIGPLELALVIAPHRPIRCLGITEKPWEGKADNVVLRDMMEFARNTGPVIKLSFDLHVSQRQTLPVIVKLFPTLSLLNIAFHYEGMTPPSKPETGIKIKDGCLKVKKPWDEADSLDNYPPPNNSTGYKALIYDVALGRLQLPPTLEILRLDICLDPHYVIEVEDSSRDFYSFEPFTFRMARRVVYAFSKQYAHLQQVHIGSKDSCWLWGKDSDGIWQAREEKF